MLHGQVVIESILQAGDVPKGQITLKLVPGAAAGYGAERGVGLAANGLHALGAPEQIGQLQQGHRLLGIDPMTLPAVDDVEEISVDGKAGEIRGKVKNAVSHGCFCKGWLRFFQLLVGGVVLVHALLVAEFDDE